jgi:hypothetical protein
VWLRLGIPADAEDLDALVAAAQASGVPLDITRQPALWGGKMRGTESVILAASTLDYTRATDETHATHLVQAHLIELLSSLGREHLDFYFLRVREAAEEYQVSGALQAMELARQEGHLRFLGILSDGSPFATLGLWQFRDAFEVLLVPGEDDDAYDMLSPMAVERRVGLVTIGRRRGDHPALLDVRSAAEVEAALQ